MGCLLVPTTGYYPLGTLDYLLFQLRLPMSETLPENRDTIDFVLYEQKFDRSIDRSDDRLIDRAGGWGVLASIFVWVRQHFVDLASPTRYLWTHE